MEGLGGLALTSWATCFCSLVAAELRHACVAECDGGSSIELLPPPQPGGGREMSSLPGIELPIKNTKQNKLVEILSKICIKFHYTKGEILKIILCSYLRTCIFSSNLVLYPSVKFFF